MNAAPAPLEKTLAALRQRMLHPTAYEKALDYFFSIVERDIGRLGRPEISDGLRAVLSLLMRRIFGSESGPPRAYELDNLAMFHLVEHQFWHGCATVSGRVLAFFYCGRLGTGIAAVMPGLKGPTEVSRFRLATSPNPENDA